MIKISIHAEARTKELACVLLSLKRVEELNYCNIWHIAALSVAIYEAVYQTANKNIESIYWSKLQNIFWEVLEDDWFHVRIAENCDVTGDAYREYVDLEFEDYGISSLAFIAIEEVKEKLILDKEILDKEYWGVDYSDDVYNLVWYGQAAQNCKN